jgi:hypothetical protein
VTKNEMMGLAAEAGLWVTSVERLKAVEKFTELVEAAEREACAKICDAECNPTPHEGHITSYQSGGYIAAEYLATAIRARGQE